MTSIKIPATLNDLTQEQRDKLHNSLVVSKGTVKEIFYRMPPEQGGIPHVLVHELHPYGHNDWIRERELTWSNSGKTGMCWTRHGGIDRVFDPSEVK